MKRPPGTINAEWLAMLAKASAAKEIPPGHAVEHAYEAGFMSGYACNNPFRPDPPWFKKLLRASKKAVDT